MTPTEAALVRLRAEAGVSDGFPGERIVVRVGDVWRVLEEVDRLEAEAARLWGVAAAARAVLERGFEREGTEVRGTALLRLAGALEALSDGSFPAGADPNSS